MDRISGWVDRDFVIGLVDERTWVDGDYETG